jgi:hypothetical protein
MDTAICAKCGPLPTTNFYRHHRRGYQSLCKKCKAEYNRGHYKKDRDKYIARAKKRNGEVRLRLNELLITYLLKHPCKCGEADPVLLDFHHKDSAQKISSIAGLMSDKRPWPEVLQEIRKCIVLCVRCHRYATAKQRGWYKLGLRLR